VATAKRMLPELLDNGVTRSKLTFDRRKTLSQESILLLAKLVEAQIPD
jgi:hypothetical protein